MKKVLLLVLAVLFVTSASFAQLNGKFAKKSQWELGGSISFTSVTPVFAGTTGDATSTFTLAPAAGYFITDGFELGAVVNFTSVTTPDLLGGSSSYSTYAFVLAPTYNFNLKSQFYPYILGAIGYNSYKPKSGDASSGLVWGFEGGLKANVAANALVKLGIGYTQQTLNLSGASDRSGANSLGVVIGVGIFL